MMRAPAEAKQKTHWSTNQTHLSNKACNRSVPSSWAVTTLRVKVVSLRCIVPIMRNISIMRRFYDWTRAAGQSQGARYQTVKARPNHMRSRVQ
jgi:hypothetical protein